MSTVIRTRAAQAVVLLVTTAMCLFSGQVAQAADRSPVGSADKQVAHTNKGSMKSKISGTTSKGREVTGSFVPLKFIDRGGQPYVKGLVQGVVHERNGSKTTFSQLKTFPLQSASGAAGRAGAGTSARATCDILHLVLGPLDLDLLGLQVHLDRVVLDIVAATGAGNLLGNLLCAVTGLLDGGPLGGVVGQLVDLLNRILGALRLG
jgi:hypothetical protein